MLDELHDIYDDSVLWQMSPHERASFLYLIEKITVPGRTDELYAIEVGTYYGGSLRQMAKWFDYIWSLDIDHSLSSELSVEIRKSGQCYIHEITGKSSKTLPPVIEQANDMGMDVGLILIDADHEYGPVRTDILNALKYIPLEYPSYILIHDSWYPPSRQAICSIEYNDYPHVHFIDTDFCSGAVMNDTVMGGLCLIQLKPEPRQGNIVIRQSNDPTFVTLRRKNG